MARKKTKNETTDYKDISKYRAKEEPYLEKFNPPCQSAQMVRNIEYIDGKIYKKMFAQVEKRIKFQDPLIIKDFHEKYRSASPSKKD